MIKMITAFTTEADVMDVAVSEIIEQIDLSRLKKNSVAIVQCHYEFINTGVLEAVCKALPFESLGFSCSLTAVNGSCDPLTLTVTVLTSDTCTFKVASFDNTETEAEVLRHTDEAARILGNGGILPKVAVAFVSLLSFTSGDKVVYTFSEALPGVPLFGTLPVSDEPDFSYSYTLHNGDSTEYGAAFLGIYGDFKPKFMLTALSEGKVYKTQGIVEKADGNTVYQIDGISAADFVVSKGIITKETPGNIVGQPAVFTYPDGSMMMRNVYAVDFEKGTFTLSGDAREGGVIDFALFSSSDIKASARALAADIADLYPDAAAVLFYSCVTLLWNLGTEATAEIDIMSEMLGSKKYQIAFSGGEIYPMLVDGKYINTFQNNNLVACII
jgi:hypothetical protein